MPINLNAPFLGPPPVGYTGENTRSVNQAHCLGGYFGANQENLSTLGMTSCCSAALYYAPAQGPAFGALTHYDGSGEAGDTLAAKLTKHGLGTPGVRQACIVFFAFHPDYWAMAGTGCLRSLEEVFPGQVQQFKHKGSASLDAAGNFFDPFQDPPGPPQGGAARRRNAGRCNIL